MMATSADRQKQKLTLSKPHRLAQSIIGQFIPLPESPLKRFGLIGAWLLAGVGAPMFVFASSQTSAPSRNMETTTSSTVTIQSTASSQAEGAASLSGEDSDMQSEQSVHNPLVNSTVTVNGETIPITDTSLSKQVTNEDGSRVDIDVTIDGSTMTYSSANNTIDVSIDSSSSTTNNHNDTRGSPRR